MVAYKCFEVLGFQWKDNWLNIIIFNFKINFIFEREYKK